jgi:radical SAM-linked protein
VAKPSTKTTIQVAPEQQLRWRVKLAVQGSAVWLSHLDLLETLVKSLRRARIPMAFSQGFNPHMLISWGPAHPVGLASTGEYLDLYTVTEPPADWQALLNAELPPGLQVVAAERIERQTTALMKAINLADYRLTFSNGCDEAALAAQVALFKAAENWPFERVSPKGRKTVDLRASMLELECMGREVSYRCRLGAGATPKPTELAAIFAPNDALEKQERLAMYIDDKEPL